MREDNRGFSLVELMVVIAIMAVVIGIFFAGTGYIASTSARSLANSIKSAIGETRIRTMGKQETVLYIYRDKTDSKYYKQYVIKVNGSWKEPEPPEVLGKHHPNLEYTVGGTDTLLADGDHILIGFDRRTGKEETVTGINADVDSSTGKLITGTASMNSIICENIKISGGGSEYNVEIIPATGKVLLK